MAGNSFTDGKVQGTIVFPDEGFRSDYAKAEWGRDLLRGWVVRHHGARHRWSVVPAPKDSRLTGIQAELVVGKTKVIYMLVEPVDNPDRHVLITKREDALDEGDPLDVIDYKYGPLGERARKPLGHNPFEALLALKK